MITIPILIGVFRYKKLNFNSRILLIVLVITLPKELLSHRWKINGFDHLKCLTDNLFIIAQFILFTWVFYHETRKKILICFFGLFLIFFILNHFMYQPIYMGFCDHSINFEYLLIMCQFFIFISEYFKRVDVESLKHFNVFWVGVGLLQFCILSIIDFISPETMTKNSSPAFAVELIRALSNYLLYLSFIPAFLCKQRSLNEYHAHEQ